MLNALTTTSSYVLDQDGALDLYGGRLGFEVDTEVVEQPVDRGYGIDFGLRDPFGNHVRVAQLRS